MIIVFWYMVSTCFPVINSHDFGQDSRGDFGADDTMAWIELGLVGNLAFWRGGIRFFMRTMVFAFVLQWGLGVFWG